MWIKDRSKRSESYARRPHSETLISYAPFPSSPYELYELLRVFFLPFLSFWPAVLSCCSLVIKRMVMNEAWLTSTHHTQTQHLMYIK